MIGKTPGIFDNVLFGTRTLLFRKEGYADTTIVVTIEEGKISAVSVEMRKAEKKEFLTQGTEGTIAIARKNPFPSKRIYVDGAWGNKEYDDDFWSGNIGLCLNGFNAHISYTKDFESADMNGFDVSFGYDIKFHSKYSSDNWVFSVEKFCFTPCIGIGIIKQSWEYDIPSIGFFGKASMRAEFALSPYIHAFITAGYDIPLIVKVKTEEITRVSAYDIYRVKSVIKDDFSYNKSFIIQLGLSLNIPLQK